MDAVLREALWTAHSRKCAYTGRLLDLRDMQVDHVLPEKLTGEPDKLQKILAALGLPSDFDLSEIPNLLPSAQGVNIQKADSVDALGPTAWFLKLAETRAPKVRENVEAINRRLESGKTFILVQQLLESGKVTIQDLSRLQALSHHALVQVAQAVGFADGTELIEIARADLPSLRQRPMKFGPNDHISFVTFIDGHGNEVQVRSCEDFDSAYERGYFPGTNTDIKLSAFLEHQCGLLKVLERARLPLQSFVQGVQVSNLALLPFSFFPDISGERDGDVGLTYADKLQAGELVVKTQEAGRLVAESEGMGHSIVEVVRADFSGAGFEEILVYEYTYATGGTLGFGSVAVLGRTTPDGLLSVRNMTSR